MFVEKEQRSLSVVFIAFVVTSFIVACKADYDFSRDAGELELDDAYDDPHSFYNEKSTESSGAVREIAEWTGAEEKARRSSCEKALKECKANTNREPGQADVADELFSRRLVNVLLSRLKFNEDGEVFRGFLEIEATGSELEALRQFGAGLLTLRQIDPIFNDVIKTSMRNDDAYSIMRDFLSWMYVAAGYLLTHLVENKEIVSSIAFTLYMLRMWKKHQYNSWLLLSCTLTIVFLLSFFISWWKLIQEAEIKHSTLQMKHAKMPFDCEPGKLTYLETVLSWFRDNTACKEYHEARMKSPFLSVTPAQALAHMLSHVIYEPLVVSGIALSKFLQTLTADMSGIGSFLTRTIICASILPVIIGTLVLMCGGSVSLGCLGFFNIFKIKGPNRRKPDQSEILESKVDRQRIELILNVNTNGQKIEFGTRDAKPLPLEPDKKEEKAIEAPEITAPSVDVKPEINNASGDCELTDNYSEPTDVPLKMRFEAIEPRSEDGGGDRALE